MEEVKIGDQIWSGKNLDVDTFRNGDPIPHAETNEEWVEAGNRGEPAWCWSTDDSEKRKEYGKLFNHYAVTDPRGLAPEGWRIPTKDELGELIILGENDDDDGILNPKIQLPLVGMRDSVFGFLHDNGGGYYWTDSLADNEGIALYFDSNNALIYGYERESGFSVRCLKS